jgi:hypothetical protein
MYPLVRPVWYVFGVVSQRDVDGAFAAQDHRPGAGWQAAGCPEQQLYVVLRHLSSLHRTLPQGYRRA